MSIKKTPQGTYQLFIKPKGQMIRKRFKTKAEAVRYQNWVMSKISNNDWNPIDDNRSLNDLIELWYKLHGITLESGENRKRKLLAISNKMNNPIASKVSPKSFSDYRRERLSEVKAKTINNDQAYLTALYNELFRMGEIKYRNPLKNLRMLNVEQAEMGFLDVSQIKTLLNETKKSTNKDTYIVTRLCLETGARWSEIEKLKGNQISKAKTKIIRLTKTKGKRDRYIPISDEVYNEIPNKSGRLFKNCWGAFRKALERTNIELPNGQMTHVLRHSFASHFMMNGGNIIVLQQILGHSKITDTMKYAHFSPTHMTDAIKLNPINYK